MWILKSEEQHKHEVSNVVFKVGIVFDEFVHTLKKGVFIFVQILTHLLVGFVTHLKVC